MSTVGTNVTLCVSPSLCVSIADTLCLYLLAICPHPWVHFFQVAKLEIDGTGSNEGTKNRNAKNAIVFICCQFLKVILIVS